MPVLPTTGLTPDKPKQQLQLIMPASVQGSVRPKLKNLVSAETEYSAALAETFGRIFGQK